MQSKIGIGEDILRAYKEALPEKAAGSQCGVRARMHAHRHARASLDATGVLLHSGFEIETALPARAGFAVFVSSFVRNTQLISILFYLISTTPRASNQ